MDKKTIIELKLGDMGDCEISTFMESLHSFTKNNPELNNVFWFPHRGNDNWLKMLTNPDDNIQIISIQVNEDTLQGFDKISQRIIESANAVFVLRNDQINVPIQLDKGAIMPTKAHETDMGFDIYTPIDCVVEPRGSVVVDTGVHMSIPDGYGVVFQPKSGLNVKSDLLGFGVIDSGYTGSLVVKLYNLGDKKYEFKAGNKIIQMLVHEVPRVELYQVAQIETNTERGNNGFGSTGK